jgi:hypothetical protein
MEFPPKSNMVVKLLFRLKGLEKPCPRDQSEKLIPDTIREVWFSIPLFPFWGRVG